MSNSNNIDYSITEEERMLIAQWNRIFETCIILLYVSNGVEAFNNDFFRPKLVASAIMLGLHGKKWELASLKYEHELFQKEHSQGGQQ